MFELCGTADGEKWYRISFLRTYERFAASGIDGDSCRPLAGISEKEVRDGVIVPPVATSIECDPGRLRLVEQSVRRISYETKASRFVEFKTV